MRTPKKGSGPPPGEKSNEELVDHLFDAPEKLSDRERHRIIDALNKVMAKEDRAGRERRRARNRQTVDALGELVRAAFDDEIAKQMTDWLWPRVKDREPNVPSAIAKLFLSKEPRKR